MALSDREQAIFDNLINGLGEEGLQVEKKVSDNRIRWIILLVLGFVLGIILLIVGVFTKLMFIGLIGFVVLLFSGIKASTFFK